MNPSSSGWIDKFGHLVTQSNMTYSSFSSLYVALCETGFAYGIHIKWLEFIPITHTPTEDEIAKANLISALYFTYVIAYNDRNYKNFITKVNYFYDALGINSSFLEKLLSGSKPSNKLELLIRSRVFLEDNLINKTFGTSVTNTLLFVDVLVFKQFLKKEDDIRNYAEELEYILINLIHHTLNSKQQQKYDERLSYLFIASLSFLKDDAHHFDSNYRDKLIDKFSPNEYQFLMDIICVTAWEDLTLDYKESEFVFGISKDLNMSKNEVENSLEKIAIFFKENASKIPHLKDHNLVEKFYENSTKFANKLILRNSKRIQKELSESKELVALISKSTITTLSVEEKRKVQNQLLDIFKSIPSLAIFILPGGAILLPIFVKLIPKLLPSSFDENRIE
ncbi:LETM1-related biofilm-associated protein [Cellulophaga sp. F20128]|uniref:LETM1-related biofilm-associated protein n=1 Tax=Cellulophaga sp. F20128 TaxID=2926413 RepID=UPI001FF26CDE|nr:LETM1-related biofilm-associated protein [Cellulophaga sp. F20128]MCK0156981.1 LETM1-related biofilm-associated protein [Cellulophaga sp. F20128]